MELVNYTLLAALPPSPPDLAVFDYDDLAELADELEELLDTESLAAVGIDFRRPPDLEPLPFSIPEAFRELVSRFELSPRELEVTCFFDSERGLGIVRAQLPGGPSADRSAQVGGTKVVVRVAGITRVLADAIVNASNTRLVLGGGVSYAIKQAAGNPAGLQASMSALAPIGPGEVVTTASFGIDTAPLILHAATAGGAPGVIRKAYEGCFRVAEERQLEVLAIPALGTGTGGLPMELCANIFASVLRARPSSASFPRVVVVVLYNDIAAADLFAEAVGAS